VGQGVYTALGQIAAEALGVPVARVRLGYVDTLTSPDAGSCSASRHTYITGNAVYQACRRALAAREAVLRAETGETHVEAEYTYLGRSRRPTTDWDLDTGECDPHISYGYGAQVALIEVDIETGEVEVLKLWAANDVGTAVNPAAVYGQSAGGVVMGLGYALTEEIAHREGRLCTSRFSEYFVPTVFDIPREYVDIQVECPDPTGPYGVKGVGETPLLPTAPAILNALADAAGIEIDDLPAIPERVWRAMQVGQRGGEPG
jgi:CO/xanthine dehydrogenase Mo-binding subunit